MTMMLMVLMLMMSMVTSMVTLVMMLCGWVWQKSFRAADVFVLPGGQGFAMTWRGPPASSWRHPGPAPKEAEQRPQMAKTEVQQRSKCARTLRRTLPATLCLD